MPKRRRAGVRPSPPWLLDVYLDGIEASETHGEDVRFCRLCRSIGGSIWVDPSIRLTHRGLHAFTSDLMKMLGLQAHDELVTRLGARYGTDPAAASQGGYN